MTNDLKVKEAVFAFLHAYYSLVILGENKSSFYMSGFIF